MAERDRVAVLGTGLMGAPMAARLVSCGHPVVVWNRTRHKVGDLAERGAVVAVSPAEAIASADAVLVMLTDAEAVAQVLFSEPSRAGLRGRTVIQASTIGSEESRRLAEQVETVGGRFLEAPVLGSIPQATDGTLIVMAGGEQDLFERWRPVLETLGTPRLIGPVGHASVLKLAMNQLIASLTAAYALSLEMVRHAGVDVDTYIDTVRSSALHAPTFDKKLGKMLGGDFTATNFPLKHMLKDVDLVIAEAVRSGLTPAAVEGVRDVIENAMRRGHADHDYSALAAGVAVICDPP